MLELMAGWGRGWGSAELKRSKGGGGGGAAAEELYREVKAEVEKQIAYLKEKREKDPYRNILSRLRYQAIHGFHSQVPTFDLQEYTTKLQPTTDSPSPSPSPTTNSSRSLSHM